MPRTLIKSLTDLSVRMNGVILPIGAVESAMARYADHLVEVIDNETYPFILASSATLLAIHGLYFAVCTSHQMSNKDHQSIGLIVRNGESVVTSGGMATFTVQGETDATDLVLFDFTAPCQDGAIDANRFFTLRDLPSDVPTDAVAFVICAGFPYGDQRYEVAEKRHLGSAKRLVVAVPAGASNDPASLRLTPSSPLDYDPDGMSGGSAFACISGPGGFEAHFAGILARAGAEELRVIEASYVLRFIAQYVAGRIDHGASWRGGNGVDK